MVGKREFEIQIHGRNPIAGKAEIFAKVYLVTTDTVRLEVEDDLRLDYADLKNILHNVLPDILTKAVYQYS